ncbi:MAG: hypothetical protein M2R45_04076 [Verrucomicrobia subdivision 3 bacterium]|nr:hypothetical protein [Limisphaerales bacterium]MCS1417015.1 hypothetical protein [Limisphaerales bacterium]
MAFNAALESYQEGVVAFVNSEAGRMFQAGQKEYLVIVKADGGFRVESVPSGDYYLEISSAEWVSMGNANALEEVGQGHLEATVPEISGGYLSEPLDVGVVQVELLGKLRQESVCRILI